MDMTTIPIPLKKLVLNISSKAEDYSQQLAFPCLHPQCSAKTVGCHSQQCNGALSVIAKNGNVIIPSKDSKGSIRRMLEGKSYNRRFYPENINEATKFNGFCSKHDNLLFAPVEKRELVVDDEDQIFAFQCRAISVEVCRLRNLLVYFKSEKSLLKQCRKKARQLDVEDRLSLERLRTIIYYEWNLLWLDNPMSQLYHAWRVLPKKLPISLASCITPDIDNRFYEIYVRVLSEFGNNVMPRLGFTLTIVPQEERTHIIMIWNRLFDPVIRAYRDRLMSSDIFILETFLNECVFCLSDDWCMNPDFWESLPPSTKDELRYRVSKGMSEQVKNIPHIITL